MKLPTVAIVGRPNVGKSTLFNRLVGRRRALVHDTPGVTRDRLIEPAEWIDLQGRKRGVRIIDTGGLGEGGFSSEIARQVQAALDEADVVLLVLDAQEGLTDADRDVLRELSRSGARKRVPVWAVANKIDAHSHAGMENEFHELGLDEVLPISAEHARGIEDLKQRILALSDSEEARELPPEETGVPRVAIVGRPNVGKSTLVNALTGNERMIVSPIAGTTVDSIDSRVEIDGRPFWLVDTAGVRRKSKTEQGVEVLSVVQTRKALERADVALLMIDGETGPVDQDEKIGGLIEDVGCSVILAINKWDTQENKKGFQKEDAAKRLRAQIRFLGYAPLLFMSAKKERGLQGLGELIEEILGQRSLKIPTKELTEFIREEAGVHNPGNVKFFLCNQVSRHPPTFACQVSEPKKIHFSLKRHLVNAIRARWGFMGTPLRIQFIQRKSRATK